MIYKAVQVIWIFSSGRVDGTGIEGTLRGPRGPTNMVLGFPYCSFQFYNIQRYKMVLLRSREVHKGEETGVPCWGFWRG